MLKIETLRVAADSARAELEQAVTAAKNAELEVFALAEAETEDADLESIARAQAAAALAEGAVRRLQRKLDQLVGEHALAEKKAAETRQAEIEDALTWEARRARFAPILGKLAAVRGQLADVVACIQREHEVDEALVTEAAALSSRWGWGTSARELPAAVLRVLAVDALSTPGAEPLDVSWLTVVPSEEDRAHATIRAFGATYASRISLEAHARLLLETGSTEAASKADWEWFAQRASERAAREQAEREQHEALELEKDERRRASYVSAGQLTTATHFIG